MRIGVVGSRTFKDYDLLEEWLNVFTESFRVVIISGGAKGADALAKRYADEHLDEDRYVEYFPDWNSLGKSAGFARNQLIVDDSDIIVAFWDGKSKGTMDTLQKAKEAKKPVFIVYF